MAPEACTAGHPCCMVLKMVYDILQHSLLFTFFIICVIIKAPRFGSWLCFLCGEPLQKELL